MLNLPSPGAPGTQRCMLFPQLTSFGQHDFLGPDIGIVSKILLETYPP